MSLQEVEHHPVAGGELTHQRIGRACRQLPGFPHALETTLNRDDIALGVETTSSGTTRHLQEFTAHQGAMAPLSALGQCGNHGAAGGHVDAGRQGFRRKDHLHQPLLEQLLNQFFPGRQDTGVMGGDPPLQGIGVNPIADRFRVLVGVAEQPCCDPGLLLRCDQTDPTKVSDRLVTAASTEDEIDRREHIPLGHLRDHKSDRWRFRLRRLRGAPFALVPLGGPPDLAVGMQSGARLVQQRMQSLGTAEAELQRDRPMVAHDQRGRAVDLLNPVGELAGIGDGGRQGDQLHRRRTVNDRFLPDRAPLGVIHVVTLIQDDGFHVGQGIVLLICLGVQHVAEDLRGHDHDRGLTVDAEVTGHQPDTILTELLTEIAQFLVGEGLERRCVKHLLAMGQGPDDGVLTDQGFSRPCGGTHDHGVTLVQGIDGLQLKVIEGKRKNVSWIQLRIPHCIPGSVAGRHR